MGDNPIEEIMKRLSKACGDKMREYGIDTERMDRAQTGVTCALDISYATAFEEGRKLGIRQAQKEIQAAMDKLRLEKEK